MSTSAARSRSSCAIARSTTRSPSSPTGRCSTTASSTRSRRDAARRARTSPCCSSTSTTSRRSTTTWATASATSCSSASPAACAAACVRPTRSHGSAATSSASCSSASPDPNEVVQTAERILAAFHEPFLVHGEPLPVSLSIGIADHRRSRRRCGRRRDAPQGGPGDVRGQARRQAALGALRPRPRAARRCRIRRAEPERATWFQRGAEQREEIVALLQRDDAIRDGVPADPGPAHRRGGGLRGARALRRGPSSRPPNAWFAQAHRFGLGYELEARAVAAALAAPGRPAGTYLTINLSPSALTSAPVQAVLPESLDGVIVELTENELLSEAPGLDAALADVRARGGRVAIDDAGAGYAGLKHVMRLGPDLIKLDRSLVAGVEHDAARASLIASFVGYGRDSGADRVRRGHRDARRPRPPRRPRRHLRPGLRHRRPGGAMGPRGAATPSMRARCRSPPPSPCRGATISSRSSALLAGARSDDDLAAAREPIARELRADRVVLRTRVRRSDPGGRPGARRRSVGPARRGRPAPRRAATARCSASPSPARESSRARSRRTAQASSHGAGSRSAARA